MSWLPDDLGPMAQFDERVLAQFNDAKSKKRIQDNEDKNTEQKLKMVHGKKKVGKDWRKFKSELDQKKSDEKKNARVDKKKGVRALSGGKWGYVKDGKFKSD
jgi:plasmid maintenance system killer protein|tara:strand:- start:1654 stop:1959 length:306 start_codon:yes stop_codon:yes gene_type:complete